MIYKIKLCVIGTISASVYEQTSFDHLKPLLKAYENGITSTTSSTAAAASSTFSVLRKPSTTASKAELHPELQVREPTLPRLQPCSASRWSAAASSSVAAAYGALHPSHPER